MKPFRFITNAVTISALFMGASALSYEQAFALDDNALPSGGNVVGGNASFDYTTPNELHVHQSTDRTVIDWDSFNIGQNALTQFHQNSSSSLAVNRVTGDGQDPTQILGTLRANGQVMVIDRNGVLFGANSVINVGSIIATTGDVSNADVMSGNTNLQIFNADTGGQIVNNGSITVSEAGLAAFVSPAVINNGVISAKMGRVQLAAGNKATLDLYGDGLVELAVDAPLENALIKNTGTINAEGGTVHMTAAVAKGVIDTVINTSGVVNVSSATAKGGKIILEGANTLVSGTLDASGKTGGGEILVGGDYLGTGTTRHAMKTTATNTAVIKANTTGDHGNGGKVILWSDDSTQMNGKIEAKGGSLSGNGGFVETSGKINLGVTGSVDASAPNGKNGEWLLDPSNVIIQGTGGNNIPVGGGTTNPPTDSYQISDSSIEAALNAGNNVTITTTNGGGSQAGDISTSGTVQINKNTGNTATLTLRADRNIHLLDTTITSTSNALNVVLNADSNANQDGAVIIENSSITTNGGYFVAGGGSGTLGGVDGILGNGDGAGADDIAAWGNTNEKSGVVFGNTNIETLGGHIIVRGHGYNNAAIGQQFGVHTYGSTLLRTTSGTIDLRGTGGTGNGENAGIILLDTSTLSSATGAIKLDGTSGASTSGWNNTGVLLQGRIESTGTGASAAKVDIKATSASVSGESAMMFGNGGTISTIDGDITINAHATAGLNNNGHITSWADALIESTGAGNITLAMSGIGWGWHAFAFLNNGGTQRIGSATMTGDIRITATEILNLDINNTLITQGSLYVNHSWDNRTIGVGSSTGDITLNNATLDRIFLGNKFVIGDPLGTSGDINVTAWDLSSKNYDVELYGNRIMLSGLALGNKNFTATAYDTVNFDSYIGINAPVTKSGASTSTLTLRADESLYVLSDITASNGALNIVLNADRDANHSGNINIFNSSINTNGGYFIAGGGSGDVGGADGIFGNGDGTGADDMDAWGLGDMASGVGIGDSKLYTQGGNIYIRGHGHDNVAGFRHQGTVLYGTTEIKTTSGHIFISGTGGLSSDEADGLLLWDTARISSATGDIRLTARNGAVSSGWSNRSLLVQGTIESTGTGASAGKIIIDSTSVASSGGTGVYIAGGKITTVDGDITINTKSDSTNNGSNQIAAGGNATIESTGAGNITITATDEGSGGHGFHLFNNGGTQTIGSATMTGDIRLTFSGISDLDGADFIRTQGSVYLKNSIAGQSVGIAGNWGDIYLNNNILDRMFIGRKLVVGDALGSTGDMAMSAWDLSAKSYDVELYGNDIFIGGVTVGNNNFTATAHNIGADDGEITLNAPFTKSGAGTSTLSLLSAQDIIVTSNITTSNGALNVLLNADRDADQDGSIYMGNAQIDTRGGYFIAGGGSGTVGGNDGIFGNGDGTGADDVAAWGNSGQGDGIRIDNSTISTGAGNLLIKGHGSNTGTNYIYGVNLSNTTLRSTTGAQNIYGTGGGTTGSSSDNYGVMIRNASLIESNGGAINVTGYGGGNNGVRNYGLFMIDGSDITSLGNGNIALKGTGGTGTISYGIFLDATGTTVTNQNGAILLEGTTGGKDNFSYGVLTTNSALVEAKGAGGITLTGTRRGNHADPSYSIIIETYSKILASGGADIVFNTATTSGTLGTDVNISNGAQVITSGGANTGNITINADTVEMKNDWGNPTIQSAGTLHFKPRTASTSIGLGGGSGTLNLSDMELGFLSARNLLIGDSVNGTGDIDLDSWDLSAKTHNVGIYGNDIDIGGLTLGTGNFSAFARDNGGDLGGITVSAASAKSVTGTSALNLFADQNIVFNSGANITTTNGTLNILLNADHDADQDGSILLTTSAISTNGGYFVAGGGSGTLWGTDGIQGTPDDATSTGADKIAAQADTGSVGTSLIGSSITTGAGNVILNGLGGSGVSQAGINVSNSSITTTSGNIKINGTGGTGQSSASGVAILNSTLEADSGNITITGTAKGQGDNTASDRDRGVNVQQSTIRALTNTAGSGNITITGDGSQSSGTGSRGIDVNTNATIQTQAGNINLSSTAGAAESFVLFSNSAIRSQNNGDILLNANNGTISLAGTSVAPVVLGDANTNLVDIRTGSIYIDNTNLSTTNSGIIGKTVSLKSSTPSSTIGLGGGAGTLNVNDARLPFFKPINTFIIGDSAAGTGDVDLDTWDLSGTSYNVEIYGNDIDVGGLTFGTGNFSAFARDNGGDLGGITVSAASAKSVTGTSTLSLYADQDIIFNSGSDIISTNGRLNMLLNADRNADQDGSMLLTASGITSNGGNITLTAGSGATGNNGITINGASPLSSSGGNITINQKTALGAAQTWDAGTGNVALNGTITAGANDLTIIGDTLAIGASLTSSGTVTLKPHTNSHSIGLGGGSGIFNLDDAELGYITAANLIIGSTSSTGNVDVDTWDLSTKAHNVQVHGADTNIAGLTTGGGNVTFFAKDGTLQVNGNSISNAAGNLSLLASRTLQINNAVTNTGTGHINLIAGWDGTSGITTPALFNIDNVDLGLIARDITLGTNANLSSAGTGTSVLIAASGAFRNNASAGVNAISTAGGRYLVYSENPTDTAKGGLTAKNLYNVGYNDNPASSITGTNSRFIYKYQPTVTVTADDVTAVDIPSATYTYSVTGLINDDLKADVLGGTANYTLGGSGLSRPITVNGLSALNGYAINYVGGTLTLTALPPSPPAVVTPPGPSVEPQVTDIINQTTQKERTDVKQDITAANADRPKDTGCLVVKSGEGCVVH